MTNQFPLGIAGSPEGTDDIGLFCDRIADGDAKDKGHNDDDNIEQQNHHGPVAAHVLAGKLDGLVLIPGDVLFQLHLAGKLLHQLLRHLVLLRLVSRRIIVQPRIAPGQVVLRKGGERLRRDHGHTKPNGIEHAVAVVREKSAVIRERHKPRDRPTPLGAADGIPHLKAVVVGIHAVNGNLAVTFRESSLHQIRPVYRLPLGKDTQRVVVRQRLVNVIQFVKGDAHLPDGLGLRPVHLFGEDKVSVLNGLFLKALVVGGNHAVIRHQKTGNKADGHGQQQEDDQVFAQLLPQLPEQPLVQWIFHAAPLTSPALRRESYARCGSPGESSRLSDAPPDPPCP